MCRRPSSSKSCRPAGLAQRSISHRRAVSQGSIPTSHARGAAADRTLRDVVALSTLPTVWLGAEPVRIVESLAASLFSVLDADLVYVVLHGDADHEAIAVAQQDRTAPIPKS